MGTFNKRTGLVLKRSDVSNRRFKVIDMHTHFGELFGILQGTKDYYECYDTMEAVEHLKTFGITNVVNLDGSFGDESKRIQEKLAVGGDFFINFATLDVARFEQPDFEKYVYQTIKEHHENNIKGLKFWKIIGLGITDSNGCYLRPDDIRLKCIWEYAADFSLPVLFHIADPVSFFRPIDDKNEYYDTLKKYPEWSFYDDKFYSFDQLMDMQINLLKDNPKTTFIIPHVGGYAENLEQVTGWLKQFPNMYIDLADRLNELGRQPYSAKKFFIDNQDRILFGTDMIPTDIDRYEMYYRFLETDDEYFSYRTEKGIPLGDWHIYGINLPDNVLEKIYNTNLKRLITIGEK